MERCESDQAEILARVKHLSGEADCLNDVFNSNQSARMNFGIPQQKVPVEMKVHLIII